MYDTLQNIIDRATENKKMFWGIDPGIERNSQTVPHHDTISSGLILAGMALAAYGLNSV